MSVQSSMRMITRSPFWRLDYVMSLLNRRNHQGTFEPPSYNGTFLLLKVRPYCQLQVNLSAGAHTTTTYSLAAVVGRASKSKEKAPAPSSPPPLPPPSSPSSCCSVKETLMTVEAEGDDDEGKGKGFSKKRTCCRVYGAEAG